MLAPACTFDALNINDGTTYTILPGVRLGAKERSYDEYMSYSGVVTQVNVSAAHLISMTIPLHVTGSSAADLRTNLTALNTKIAAATAAVPLDLVYAGATYYIVAGSELEWEEDLAFLLTFWTEVDLQLNRKP